MTVSTIALLNAIRTGQELPPTVTPVKAVKAVKPMPVLSETQRMEREAIRARLQVGTWIIEFNKVDGSKSIMEVTLDPRLLPIGDPSSQHSTAEAAHILRVYAVDRQGWRSFVTTNVTRMYKAAVDM